MSWMTRGLGDIVVGAAIVAVVLLAGIPRITSRAAGTGTEPPWPPPPFTVALVWPAISGTGFTEGVTLALEEVDASGTPLAGKIRLARVEEGTDGDAVGTARRVAATRGVVAVLGHEFSDGAVPASLVYDQHGLVFFAPTATAALLTRHPFRLVFRLTPDDRLIAAAHVRLARSHGWSNVAVFFARTAEGEAAGAQFVSQMRDAGVNVSFTRSYLPPRRGEHVDFRPLIADMDQHLLDAVVIADQLPRAATFVTDLRKMGYRGPILGSDKLDDDRVWALTGGAAQDLYVASAMDPAAVAPDFLAFRERFKRRWHEEPSYLATQGFDALRLLTEAMVASQSIDPLTVSTTLRSRKWLGLFGEYSFDWSGDIQGRRVYIKRMDAGRFVTVAGGKGGEQ